MSLFCLANSLSNKDFQSLVTLAPSHEVEFWDLNGSTRALKNMNSAENWSLAVLDGENEFVGVLVFW
jgi:hypothetical protein